MKNFKMRLPVGEGPVSAIVPQAPREQRKPLLVGEANPYQSNEADAMAFALYPEPPHASGGRLCRYVMGLDVRTYLRAFDRVDLCHPKWNMKAARAKAAQLMAERGMDDVIVLCGAKVANAFGVLYEPFTIRWTPHRALTGPRLVVLPHPSGLNRAWHQPNARERAREILREVGCLPQSAKPTCPAQDRE